MNSTPLARISILAGGVLFFALLPLTRYPTLLGENVAPLLVSFCAAGLAYLLALAGLTKESPSLRVIWGFAVLFRIVMLLTPVSLSEDVYRYVWDGHLLNQGINPYFAAVNSPLLDPYATELRARVNFPWMATPYLSAAQVYFAFVEAIAPQSTFAFQVSAAALDLAAGALVLRMLRRLCIPEKAVLVYLWNPLVVIEFAHGAHIDALMVFFLIAALSCRLSGRQTLSALALAGGVLVKGWPALVAPLLAVSWGVWRTGLFGACVLLILSLFAAEAGWGLVGPLDGRGVFGALRLYSFQSTFNPGLYLLLEPLLSPASARLLGLALPGLLGLGLGWQALREEQHSKVERGLCHDPACAGRRVARRAIIPLAAYLLLAPTIHPWYLAMIVVLLPFFWPAQGESPAIRRWIWPWMYFMFLEGFTYLVYSGMTAPPGLPLLQTAAYLPLWGLLVWAGRQKVSTPA